MTTAWWLGLGLGTVIGGAYGAASFLNARYAVRQTGSRFLYLVVGGMIARLGAALALAALVLLLTPAHRPAFVVSLLIMLALGLTAEVIFFHRR